MKILLTNDDGLNSEGLAVLLEKAGNIGEITVVAPLAEQSCKSHGIEVKKPFAVNKCTLPGAVRAYAVDSTPADCVRFAIEGLGESFDLVLSGINRGYNLGKDILYSGTVGACFEASAFGVKAVAVSTFPESPQVASAYLKQLYELFCERELLKIAEVFNINVPDSPKGILFTRQGGPYYRDRFTDLGDGTYIQRGYCAYESSNDLTYDTDAVMNGYISVTPLTTERTDLKAYETLK
ncbi:MAG: 5'/3'-nucleotidase SurE [Clostridia bacterium]|nr:5'/3'-nucleotidase SurE [Clostridia bacterium]